LCDLIFSRFSSGDAEKDAASMRIFVKDGHDIAIAQSYAKNFGLYGERIGCFRFIAVFHSFLFPRLYGANLKLSSMVGQTSEEADRLLSQIKILIRPM
jgi:aspartate aminotransferase, mitochondrial